MNCSVSLETSQHLAWSLYETGLPMDVDFKMPQAAVDADKVVKQNHKCLFHFKSKEFGRVDK